MISEFLEFQIVTSNPKLTECNECQAYANAHINSKVTFPLGIRKTWIKDLFVISLVLKMGDVSVKMDDASVEMIDV